MKISKFILACALLFANALLAFSQDAVIRGKVFDKTTGEPVGWATVMLLKADSTVVAGTSCDENGKYELKASAGEYTLAADLLGYKKASRTVKLKSGTNEAEPFQLETDTEMLAGAKVTERVSLVEMKIDKVVVNVSQSAFAQGSNALDLLKKSPGVTIDKDGNVKLNGKTVSVWIDGRPSYMDGKSLETLLRTTGSETIERFELMEHPSSKYDAAGQGGIINIKTKRNLKQGFNGSAGIKGGAMYFKEIDMMPYEQGAWATLGYRTNKSNTVLNISEQSDILPMTLGNNLTIEPVQFEQNSCSQMIYKDKSYNFKLAHDWFVNDKNTVGAIVSLPFSENYLNTTSSSTRQYVNGELMQETSSSIENGPSRTQRASANANWTHVFNPALASEITTNVDYYHNTVTNFSEQIDTTFIGGKTPVTVFNTKTMNTHNLYDIYSAKTDYQSVVWQKFMLETGAKWAMSHTDNDYKEQNTGVDDICKSFIYREHIAAGYASLAGQLGKKVSFKGGLRGEYTYSHGDWMTSAATTRSYFNLFPTLYIGYQPAEKWRFSASLTRRITRPSYSELNPAKVYLDAKTYTIGDPEILPEYNTDISASAGYGQHFTFALTYDRMRNTINQIPSYDTDGIQALTWGNFGTIQMGIATFNVSALPLTKWLQWTLSANGIYASSVSVLNDEARKSLSLQGYTALSFVLPKDWKADLDCRYSAPMKFGCYNIHSNWMSDLAVKKSLCEDKLQLSVNVNDLFRSFNNDIDIVDVQNVGAMTTVRQKYYMQKVTLSITWNFGKAQKPVRQRNVGNLEEASRASGSKGLGK